MISIFIVTIGATLMVICFYHFVFKDYGPLHFGAVRHAQANRHLVESGDAGQKPLTLLAMCALVGGMGLDGFMTGTALMTSVFAQWLSPRGALLASVGWSIGCTYLLYKLVMASAHEAVINERRSAIRVLSSGDAAQQAKAEAMKLRVGEALGHDYSMDANRIGARVALFVTVGILVAATFAMRTTNVGYEAAAPAGTATPTVAPMPTTLPVSRALPVNI